MFSSPQLINLGPSSISRGVLELSCPQALEGQQLLYMTRVTGLGNCTTSHPPNSQGLEVRGLETGMGRGTKVRGVEEGPWRPGRTRMCLKLRTEVTEQGAEGPQTPQGCGREKDHFIHSLEYPSLPSGPGIPLGPISVPPSLGRPLQTCFPGT